MYSTSTHLTTDASTPVADWFDVIDDATHDTATNSTTTDIFTDSDSDMLLMLSPVSSPVDSPTSPIAGLMATKVLLSDCRTSSDDLFLHDALLSLDVDTFWIDNDTDNSSSSKHVKRAFRFESDKDSDVDMDTPHPSSNDSDTSSHSVANSDGSWVVVEMNDVVVVDQQQQAPTVESLDSVVTQHVASHAPSRPMTRRRAAAAAAISTATDMTSLTHKQQSVTPVIEAVQSAKPARTRRTRKAKALDPTTRVVQRKTKQRGYERTYRTRLHTQRCQDEVTWLAHEATLRQLLARTHHAIVCSPHVAVDDDKTSDSQRQMMHTYVQLVYEVRALEEQRAYIALLAKWCEALDTWGFETDESCQLRFELNSLPLLPAYPTFAGFCW